MSVPVFSMTLEDVREKFPIGSDVIIADGSIAEVVGHQSFPPINGQHFAGILVIDKNGFQRHFNPEIGRIKICAIQK